MTDDRREDLRRRIEAIEKGYEYMLAYAAQGRDTDEGPGAASPGIRAYLEAMDQALDGLGAVASATVAARSPELAGSTQAFLDALAADAQTARGAIHLVLAQTGISSLLIDNLNASIHVRALLTDLFVIDEALKKLA